MKRTILFLIFSFLIIALTNAQRWKSYRWDAVFGLGTTAFFGDLGGGGGAPSHFLSFRDWDLSTTRPVLHGAVRYKFNQRLAVKTNLSAGLLKGDDAESQSWRRKIRNLNFRSQIYEGSVQFEYSFLKEKFGSRYAIRKASFKQLINGYFFAGIGGFYFNPETKYMGDWYKLQPLGTEGQGISLNPPKYDLFALAFPVGIGFKYTIDRMWSVGLEVGTRYTTTDYIDDVGGSYYNFQAELDAGNITYEDLADPIVIKLADRHLTEDGKPAEPYETGIKIRSGQYSRYKDAYMFIVVYASVKLKNFRRGVAKYN